MGCRQIRIHEVINCVKVALIGASGHISKRHITAYQQLKEENIAEIVACCDIHPDTI